MIYIDFLFFLCVPQLYQQLQFMIIFIVLDRKDKWHVSSKIQVNELIQFLVAVIGFGISVARDQSTLEGLFTCVDFEAHILHAIYIDINVQKLKHRFLQYNGDDLEFVVSQKLSKSGGV
eukprot:TRINITY_DN62042_c0_g1_i5.p4 TRINITY_DN62042_c0_g1~~TRINITY_DN62042_c0_g1_i5.p4  ORF type:complete len:119 (+),score=4.44 TRINITY_DN62042_c0_g1_i5:280-636(+)